MNFLTDDIQIWKKLNFPLECNGFKNFVTVFNVLSSSLSPDKGAGWIDSRLIRSDSC